jgi:hypothetical protein
MRLILSSFPKPGSRFQPSALVAIGEKDSVQMSVLFSKSQILELSRDVDPITARAELLQEAVASSLPAHDTRLSFEVSPYTAARILDIRRRYKGDNDPPSAGLTSSHPYLVVFEATTKEQHASFRHIAPDPDFMSCGIDSEGNPEVCVGFSKKDAYDTLRARQAWNVSNDMMQRCKLAVQTSALPHKSQLMAYKITGSAAGFVFFLLASEALARQAV